MGRAETQGSTERFIGSWLKARGRRDDLVIASKIAGPNASMGWIRGPAHNLDAANIRAAVESSLQRLQTDYTDLYQIHWPSRNLPIFGANSFNPKRERSSVPVAETLGALGELVKTGNIREIGVSNESSWDVCEYVKQAEMHGLPRIATIQNLYNLRPGPSKRRCWTKPASGKRSVCWPTARSPSGSAQANTWTIRRRKDG